MWGDAARLDQCILALAEMSQGMTDRGSIMISFQYLEESKQLEVVI